MYCINTDLFDGVRGEGGMFTQCEGILGTFKKKDKIEIERETKN